MFYRRNHNPGVVSLTKGVGYFGKKDIRLSRVSRLQPGSILRVTKEYGSLIEVSYGKTELISRHELNLLFEEVSCSH